MRIQEICEGVVEETDGALGCLLIDLSTGLTLASSIRAGMALEPGRIRTILRLSEDLFRGRFVDQFVRSLPNGRSSARGFVREVQTATVYTYQFMAAVPDWDDGVVVLITEKSLNLGLGWMAVHQAQQEIAAARRAAREQPPGARAAAAGPEPAARAGSDSAQHAQSLSPAPVPPTPPTSAPVPPAAAMPEPPQSPPRVQPAWDPAAAAAFREQPPARAGDSRHAPPPAPEPPASQPAPAPAPHASQPVPAPEPPAAQPSPPQGIAKESDAGVADEAAPEPRPDDEPETRQPVLSGPRARMFKPRTGKKKNR